MRSPSRLFWAAIAVGAVLRVLVARSTGGRLDSDQAVVYLMARHGGGGLLFWGQGYGGTLLQLTAAGAFAVLGASVPLLQLVEALWWLAAALLGRAVGTRLGDRFTGDLAGALLWLPGPTLLWLTVRDPGFYGPAVALGLAALLLALQAPRRALLLGVVLGLGVWTSPLGLAFGVPALGLVLLRRRGIRLTLAGLAVGLVPYVVALSRHSDAGGTARMPLAQLPHRAAEVVFTLLPAAWVGDSVLARGVVGAVEVLAVLGGLVAALALRRADLGAVALAGALTVLVVAGSSAVLLPVSLRYGALLAPAPLLLLAVFYGRLGQARWLGWGLVLVLTVSTVSVTARVTDGFAPGGSNHWEGEGGDLRRTDGRIGAARPADVPALVRHLRALGVRAAWADYWVAYCIDAESDEQVLAAPLYTDRHPAYAQAAAAQERTAFVVYSGFANEDTVLRDASLPSYARTQVAQFTVFVFSERVDRSRLPGYAY
ncbi:MAG: hypothetical protein ACXVFV_09750 [Mycobacteriales bacterium]